MFSINIKCNIIILDKKQKEVIILNDKDKRRALLWYKHTIEELEAMMIDHPLTYEEKKNIVGTITVLKRLKKEYQQKEVNNLGKVIQHQGKLYGVTGDKELCVATKATPLPNNKKLVEDMRFAKGYTENEVVDLIKNNKYETLSKDPNNI